MTGAAIVRWEAGSTVVLAVHGAFDGASAWGLQLEMEGSPSREFLIDLTHAVEACEFAASLLEAWARRWRRLKRVRFRPGSPEHARILSGHGLELEDVDDQPREKLRAEGTEDLARVRAACVERDGRTTFLVRD